VSAPGLVPAYRYVRARVTWIDPTPTTLGDRAVHYFQADAVAEPTLHFGMAVLPHELPAVGDLVTFRLGPNDQLHLVTARPPMTHELKCAPEPFEAVLSGAKKHETRVDDRDYRVGDTLTLHEWVAVGARDLAPFGCYTGRVAFRRVTYKSEGGTWGLPVGLCVLSIEAL
jgi:hypothetical protein